MTTQGHHEATRPYQLGIDVGSTTVKAVVLDGNRRLFSDYRRHNADVRASLGALLADVDRALPGVVAGIDVDGSLVSVRVALAEGVSVSARVTASAWSELGLGVGDRLWASVKATQVRAIPIAPGS